nr:hypothetical protein CFP56_53068 [Quercus suber]
MSRELRDIAQWYLLYNCPELEPYLDEYKNTLHNPTGEDITQIQRREFPKWFKERIYRLKENDSSEVTKQMWSLANGPKLLMKEYSVDDDDYVPAVGDDEVSSSLNNEMALGRSTRSRREKFTPTVQHKGPLSSLLPDGDSEMARYRCEKSTPAVQHTGPASSTHLGGDSLAQISTNVEAQLVDTPSTMDASTSRRARGMTRGLGLKRGRYSVLSSRNSRAPSQPKDQGKEAGGVQEKEKAREKEATS